MKNAYAGAGSSQELIPIKDIRDGIVILKDGSMRAIIMASSVNFSLKSTEEQQGIIFQFQNFLNSLKFETQIVVQSRKFDIMPYVNLLKDRQKEQTNDLLKIQTKEYIEFVRSFTEQYNVMTKNFFVVVSYTPAIASGGGFGSRLKGKKDQQAQEATTFENNRSQLEQRVSVVQQGLTRSGVRVVPLGTEELTEVYYRIFNPGETEKKIG